MSKIVRPGRPAPSYLSESLPKRGPSHTPAVFHQHGSRRQALYEQVDREQAVAESLTTIDLTLIADVQRDTVALVAPRNDWRTAQERLEDQARLTRLREADKWEREQRERDARSAQAWQSAMTRQASELRARLGGNESARPYRQVTEARRETIHVLAQEFSLTSAQMLTLVRQQFGEYVKGATSTIASVVANDIRAWALTEQGQHDLSVLRQCDRF